MRLLLTLLALLTGLATADRAVAAPAVPAAMGALVLLLLWMYYAAVVFFAGALITAVIDERMHSRSKLEAAGFGDAASPARGA